MIIAITDANIFIDLLYTGLLDKLFGIGVEIHTTLNVVDELDERQQKALLKFHKKKLLTIHSLEELSLPEPIRTNRKLSDSDKSVLSLALQLEAMILTGDAVLRRVSGVQKIEVHGMLWLLDRFLEHKLMTKKQAVKQLIHLREYNKRLPHDECEKRIAAWS